MGSRGGGFAAGYQAGYRVGQNIGLEAGYEIGFEAGVRASLATMERVTAEHGFDERVARVAQEVVAAALLEPDVTPEGNTPLSPDAAEGGP